MRTPRVVRLYVRLQRLLPCALRAVFGREMRAAFVLGLASARTRGRLTGAWYVTRELLDLVRVGVTERLRTGPSHRRGGDRIARELRLAVRRLVRAPVFAAGSVATLAIALGALALVFTLFHGIVLAPLPWEEGERLVALDHAAPGVDLHSGLGMSIGMYTQYAALPELDAVAIHYVGEGTLTGEGPAERVRFVHATPSLGDVLRLRPEIGRWFARDEGVSGGPRTVVLTHAFWRSRFGASDGVVGSTLLLDGVAYEVVGVLAPGGALPDAEARLVLPLQLDASPPTRAGGFNYSSVGRLADGITPDQLRTRQVEVIADLSARFPGDTELAAGLIGAGRLAPHTQALASAMVGDTGRMLGALLAAAFVLVAMACANLANLFFVRAEGRRREAALQRALGASVTDVVSGIVAETLLVALIGGLCAIALASFVSRMLVHGEWVQLPRLHEVGVGGATGAFTLLSAVCAGLLMALLPAMRQVRIGAAQLREHGRGVAGSFIATRTRHALMAIQVALSVVLVTAACLIVQSFVHIVRADPGFAASSRLTFRIAAPPAARGGDGAATFHHALLDRFARLPGVVSAGATSTLPLEGVGQGNPIDVFGSADAALGNAPVVRFRRITHDYLRAIGTRLLAGRMFTSSDRDGVVVIDEELARIFFPGEDPVGQRIRRTGGREPYAWLTIVGVVEATVTTRVGDEPRIPKLYVPLDADVQAGVARPRELSYVLHVTTEPLALVAAVRNALADAAPDVALARPERLGDVVARARSATAFVMLLLVASAGVALALGLLGVHAVIAFAVTQRRGEIGVRLALGARRWDVIAMIVAESGRAIAAGIVLGLFAGAAGLGLLEGLVFGVARDTSTRLAVASGCFVAAIVASWISALRTTQVRPVDALRGT